MARGSMALLRYLTAKLNTITVVLKISPTGDIIRASSSLSKNNSLLNAIKIRVNVNNGQNETICHQIIMLLNW